MKRSATTRTPGIFTRTACAAVLAGCCLLAPAVSLAAPASAAADSRVEASAAKDASQTISLGDLCASVPADWEVMDLGDAMVVSSSPDGTMKAVMIAGDEEYPDGDGAEQYFSAKAEGEAEALGAELVGGGVGTLLDGTQVYTAIIDASKTDDAVYTYGIYVPTEKGELTTLVVTVSADAVDETEDAVSAILDSLNFGAPASADAQLPELEADATAGGIDFSMPDGMAVSDDEGSMVWVNEDGFVVAVVPNASEGDDSLTSDDLELIAQIVAASFQGTTIGSATIDVSGTSVSLCAFACESEGAQLMGFIGLVNVPGQGVTALMSMCPMDVAETYGAVMDAIVNSIELS